jgi:hypothetical protein
MAFVPATQPLGFSGPTFAASNARAAAAAGTAADTGLQRGTVADILGLQSKAEIDAANAQASDIQAAGYQQEVGAYTTAGEIAGNNAVTAGIAGDIKLLQEQRALKRTLGSQRADIASAGFRNSGSAIDLMQSSVQQGALGRQLISTQTALAKGGYLEEGAASAAEAAGATMASTAAAALAEQQRSSGQLATANAANETAALQTYLAGTTPTPEGALVTSTLSAPGGTPTTFNPATVSSAKGVSPETKDRTKPPELFTGFGSQDYGAGRPMINTLL